MNVKLPVRSAFGSTALLSLVLLAAPTSATPARADGSHASSILRFSKMYGVDEFLVGSANPVRGISGDSLPWQVEQVKGFLDVDGHLVVHVRGVVFRDDPIVPPDLRGINDEANFRAAVSCQTDDGTGHLVDKNLFTGPFPATLSGNSDMDTFVILPQPCIAPVVFIVAGEEDDWFAVSGFEEEE